MNHKFNASTRKIENEEEDKDKKMRSSGNERGIGGWGSKYNGEEEVITI